MTSVPESAQSVPPATADIAPQDAIAGATGPVAPEAIANSAPGLPAFDAASEAPKGEVVAAATGPVTPEPVDTVAEPDSTRRAG
jgi:hypothetical protein